MGKGSSKKSQKKLTHNYPIDNPTKITLSKFPNDVLAHALTFINLEETCKLRCVNTKFDKAFYGALKRVKRVNVGDFHNPVRCLEMIKVLSKGASHLEVLGVHRSLDWNLLGIHVRPSSYLTI